MKEERREESQKEREEGRKQGSNNGREEDQKYIFWRVLNTHSNQPRNYL